MDDDDLYSRIFAMADGSGSSAVASPSGTNFASGLMQNALALGQSYLSRRIDIDLQGRLAGMQATVQRRSNQTPINESPDLTTRGVQAIGGLQLGNLLPFIVLAGVAYLVLGKR